tara:strand:- start:43934 stop:44128 length:195 start_codon:yes stop_codon:yes gene_type:complete
MATNLSNQDEDPNEAAFSIDSLLFKELRSVTRREGRQKQTRLTQPFELRQMQYVFRPETESEKS